MTKLNRVDLLARLCFPKYHKRCVSFWKQDDKLLHRYDDC